MNAAEIDIETIVREVMRRLREASSETNNGSGIAERHIAATQCVAQSLEINDRVVTLATFEGKLSGIHNIVLTPRAIVTPAARDELKQRNIAIVRGEAAKNNGVAKAIATSGFIVGVATSGVCEVELRKLLGKTAHVMQLSASDAAVSVKALGDAVVAGGSGVLITSTPTAAVMLANRTSGVRAAYGFNFPAIRRAKDEMDANLLILEPAGRSLSELVGMIAEFQRK